MCSNCPYQYPEGQTRGIQFLAISLINLVFPNTILLVTLHAHNAQVLHARLSRRLVRLRHDSLIEMLAVVGVNAPWTECVAAEPPALPKALVWDMPATPSIAFVTAIPVVSVDYISAYVTYHHLRFSRMVTFEKVRAPLHGDRPTIAQVF